MYHFFVKEEQISAGRDSIAVTGSDVNHIRNVLRMKPGEQILISGGTAGEYLCEIQELGQDAVTARIISEYQEGTELPSKLYLFQGLPKGDKMDLIVQKAVELGVYQVIPVETRRTVVKLDSKKAEARVRRWNAISESAAKQSGRSIIPEVTSVKTWKEALAWGEELDICMIPYENARGMLATRQAVEKIKPGMSVGILIGPEGGFEEKEVEEAGAAGFLPVSLGRRILRTETAGLALLSVLMYHVETQARP